MSGYLAGSMNHVSSAKVMEQRVFILIRYLSGNYFIHVLFGSWYIIWMKPNAKMAVR